LIVLPDVIYYFYSFLIAYIQY